MLLPKLLSTLKLEWISLLQNFIYSSVSLWQLVFTLFMSCPLKSISFLNFYFNKHLMLSYSPYSISSSPSLFTRLLRLVQTEQFGSIQRILYGYFLLRQQFLHLQTFLMQGHLQESLFCKVSRILSLQMRVRQSKQNFFSQEVAWQDRQHWYTSFPLSLHMWHAPILTKETVEHLLKGSCLTFRLALLAYSTTDYFLSLSRASEIYSIIQLNTKSAYSTSIIILFYSILHSLCLSQIQSPSSPPRFPLECSKWGKFIFACKKGNILWEKISCHNQYLFNKQIKILNISKGCPIIGGFGLFRFIQLKQFVYPYIFIATYQSQQVQHENLCWLLFNKSLKSCEAGIDCI